jgi:alpha-aminoadipate carrier protein LysW
MKISSECPVCAAEVVFPDDAVEGELISCPDCGTELEIISIDPPNLEEAPQEEEDWGE